MKFLFLIISICCVSAGINGQVIKPLTIEDCYKLAQKNYPLVKQKELIAKTREYSLENASKDYLPQISFNGQATYQSDVTEIPIKIPNTTIPGISKDQYKIYTEIDQIISDGGVLKTQKQSIEVSATVEDQKLEVELYGLKERINQLFFGILLANEQDTLTEILKKDIQNGLAKIKAAIANGTALKTSADVLQAELLKVNQHTIELEATRNAFFKMLSQFIDQPVDENSVLEKPAQISVSPNITRPELSLFEKEQKMIDTQTKLLKAKIQPKIGLFLQAGYGRPALNMLKNDFTGYYIGGIRASWPLSNFYTNKKDKALLENNRKSIGIQKETFLFNVSNILQRQKEDVFKLRELVRSDDEIIVLRNRIKTTATAQLEFGVINSSDYLREVNAEAEAKQNQSMHRIQLLMAQYDQQTTSGN
ncbi:MAG: TolC family protein [Ginsengibacter sp.]